MRISNQEAKEQAIVLATTYLASQPARPEWQSKAVDATPDLSATHTKNRKTVISWAVVVEWSSDGSVLDGPAILLVNIDTMEVLWA